MAQPKVFVSHSSNDLAFARRFVVDLRQAGVEAWLDTDNLSAGDFQERISEALSKCEWFILVLTRSAIASPWVTQEVHAANRLKHLGRIRNLVFIQAGPVEQDELPAMWGVYNIFDATREYVAALASTLSAVGVAPERRVSIPPATPTARPVHAPTFLSSASRLPAQLAALGFTAYAHQEVEWIVPPLCPVPAGLFRLGSDRSHDRRACDDELNRREVNVGLFEIGRFPVTVAEYACFVTATHRREPASSYNNLTWKQQIQLRQDHPVVNVSWHDLSDYADWLAERMGQRWRLPTEAEWEKAARCDPNDPLGLSSQRRFPWGHIFDNKRCNTKDSLVGRTVAVGRYNYDNPKSANGASPCGSEDMAGNVWEWTASEWARDYRYAAALSQRKSPHSIILRGGSWSKGWTEARSTYRFVDPPDAVFDGVGGRIVRIPPIHT